jgi:hypothetical protein
VYGKKSPTRADSSVVTRKSGDSSKRNRFESSSERKMRRDFFEKERIGNGDKKSLPNKQKMPIT